jgi:hypothetical protein
VKAKSDYLWTDGCYRLRSALIVMLCTSRGDGANSGNNLENLFFGLPHSNVITLCWLSGISVNLSPCRASLYTFGNRRKLQRLSHMNKGADPFL